MIGKTSLSNILICNMNKKIIYIQHCTCGAVTVTFEDGNESSMYEETFRKLHLDTQNAQVLNETYTCNHCVNHWGIDLCECGSGCRVGECECGSNNPHDELGVTFDSFGAMVRNFSRYM